MFKVSQKKNLNAKVNGKPIIKELYKGNWTRKQIRNFVQSRSNALKEKGKILSMGVSLKYPDHVSNSGWKTPFFRKSGENVILFENDMYDDDEPDPDNYKEFVIYYKTVGNTRGGKSEHNDCLYDCLKRVVGKLPWVSAEKFKQFLGLQRDDLVDISLMNKVESKLLRHKINVTGDHIYTSVKPSILCVSLTLTKGHYKIDTEAQIKLYGICYNERKPLLYTKDKDNDNTIIYDGEIKKNISTEDFKVLKDFKKNKTYILIKYVKREKKVDRTIEEYFNYWNDAAKKLIDATNGFINLYKTGSDKKTALNLWNYFCKDVIAEHIKQDEAYWIKKATYSNHIFADNYEGECYKYDICSMFPYIMSNTKSLFPMKRGTFHKSTNLSEFFREDYKSYKFGIYRCVIISNDEKLFKYNIWNHYTNIDMNRAHELNLKIDLIIDDQPNILIYDRHDCVTGSQLFKEFVDYMFNLKKFNIPRSKVILVTLWGALSENRDKPTRVSDKLKLQNFDNNTEITSIVPINDDVDLLKIVKCDYMFVTNYARIMPFLMSQGRSMISKLIEPNKEFIVKCHTDSMFSSKKLDIKTGNNLGDLKYEGYCNNVKISNKTKVVGKFK